MANGMFRYQPTWHNMREGVSEGARSVVDAIKEKKRLNEQARQFDIAQNLAREQLAAQKAQWSQDYGLRKKGFDLRRDESIDRRAIQGQQHQMNVDEYDYKKGIRRARSEAEADIVSHMRTVAEKESDFQNNLRNFPLGEGLVRDIWQTKPFAGVQSILGLFGKDLKSREAAARRQSGFGSVRDYAPDILGTYGDRLGLDALKYAQMYQPWEEPTQTRIDRYSNNPLMMGAYNQYRGQ